ncbi:TolC family protein [Balneolaceae bacterium YR4-1]|uniref:TolC family protein n=1 Tax=Halalkalibaculum roseum TaxID=2709311 RepID=A0A6M1SNW9_9BACT|nr:TolC family protein [Halalkalibaculum roseum]NGP76769.1 TolC family protein [Halalkalibaculum roseum]
MHNSNLYPFIKVPATSVSAFRIIALSVCLCAITVNSATAQNEREERLSDLISKVDSLVAYHTETAPVTDKPSFKGNLEELFSLEYSGSGSYEVKVIEAEQDKLHRDIGLDLNAGYLENLEQGVFNVEGIYYRRRAQLELEWDILNNGYLDNRHEIRELENEKQIARFEYAGRRQADEIDSLQYAFKNYFTGQKASLVRDYLAILEDRHRIATELYQLNYKPWEEVIEVTSKRAQAEVELENLLSRSRQFANLELPVSGDNELPLLNIRINKLLEEGQFESLQDSIFAQQVGKIDNEYNSWRDISLSTFVRYNYYNSTSDVNISNIRNREYFSVGLNLSVPLPLLKSSNQKIAKARENLFKAELTRTKNRSSEGIYSDYSRYQEKLQQYLSSYQQLLQLNTSIRKQQQRQELNDPAYSPLVLFELLAERIDVKRDLLSIKQDMYEILIEVRDNVPGSDFSEFIYVINPDDYFADSNSKLSKTAYLWSSQFNKLSNQELVEFLVKHGINQLLLSTGTDSLLRKKAANFIPIAESRGIKVEWMIGDNDLLMPGHDTELEQLFSTGKKLGMTGIHLDVEPHARNDWDSRKGEYKVLYLEMLGKAQKLAGAHGLSLSVSVPVFYDSIIEQVAELTDDIYVMAYGMDDSDKVKEKVEGEMKVMDENLAIALRPEDFQSLNEFESFIEKLSRELNVRTFAIHDIESLMKLDNSEVTLNYYEE